MGQYCSTSIHDIDERAGIEPSQRRDVRTVQAGERNIIDELFATPGIIGNIPREPIRFDQVRSANNNANNNDDPQSTYSMTSKSYVPGSTDGQVPGISF